MGYMLKNIMCYNIIIFTIVWLLAINSFFGNGDLQTAPEWAEREDCYLMTALLVQSGVLIQQYSFDDLLLCLCVSLLCIG